MKLVYGDIGKVFEFGLGFVNELVVENKKLFFEIVNDMALQSEGLTGKCVLSIKDKPVEFSRYADLSVQFAPFQVNRKNLLTKLCAAIEQNALAAENFLKTGELLNELEKYIFHLSEDFPFEIECQKVAIGPIIRALCPQIEENEKRNIEKIFEYMEFVREIDKDRLFVMVNMRTYFDNDEMQKFIESACLHDFKVLLLENNSFAKLTHTQRYTIDEDLCEF